MQATGANSQAIWAGIFFHIAIIIKSPLLFFLFYVFSGFVSPLLFSLSLSLSLSFSLFLSPLSLSLPLFLSLLEKGKGKGRKNKIREKCPPKNPFSTISKKQNHSFYQDSMNSGWIIFFPVFNTNKNFCRSHYRQTLIFIFQIRWLPPPSRITCHKRIKGWACSCKQ